MTISHVKVKLGEGWSSVATRLCPPMTSQTKRNEFLTKLLSANGATVKTVIFPGEILHFDSDDIPPTQVVVSNRSKTTVPFNVNSPFNTYIPAGAQWLQVPILNIVTTGQPYPQPRHWYAGEGQLVICHGEASDPLWTIRMPDFGDTNTTFNRYWKANSWQMHLPALGPTVGINTDAVLALLDETDGNYTEIGNASCYTIDVANKVITGVAGVWWARGNVDTGAGVGGLLSVGGNSAGIRAANFSWMAGAITGYDVARVQNGSKDDFGHALCVMLGMETLSKWGVSSPATAPNNAGNDGPINNGARIGIPSSVSRPIELVDKFGIAYWNTLQRYGAFVGDFAGGPWPIFQIDIGSVPKNTLDSMWVWWTPGSAAPYVTPELRVMV